MIRIPIAAFLAAALAAGGVALPGPALAQDLPSYAQPAPASQDETITGRIEAVVDAFHFTVRDDRGFVDNVQLHQGTIINPRGLTLEGGMSVTIIGRNAGAYFDAVEIDTPYSYSGEVPSPAYYGAGWWYPGYDYGFGPAFALGLAYGFGTTIIVVHQPFRGHPWNGQPWHGRNAPPGANAGQPGRRYPLAGNGTAGQRVITTAPAYRSAGPQANVYRAPAYRAAPSAQRAAAPAQRAAPARSAPAAHSPHG
jgi:hypothetical protein